MADGSKMGRLGTWSKRVKINLVLVGLMNRNTYCQRIISVVNNYTISTIISFLNALCIKLFGLKLIFFSMLFHDLFKLIVSAIDPSITKWLEFPSPVKMKMMVVKDKPEINELNQITSLDIILFFFLACMWHNLSTVTDWNDAWKISSWSQWRNGSKFWLSM